ncbi:MAG: hypothetical protein WC732_05295 [Candidatus Omnitrophota bacterium]
MVEPSAYLFLGSDEFGKHQKLELLSRDLFPSDLKELNYTLLYGDDRNVSAAVLQETLRMMPTEGARKRVVVVRLAHCLQKSAQEALIKICRTGAPGTLLVIDIPQARGHEVLVRALEAAGVKSVSFKEAAPLNVFDLGRAIAEQKPERSLKILSGLLQSRERPEKVLGGLFWQWEKFGVEKKIAPDTYARGVKLMCEADRRLKSSASAYAREHVILESLVIKLSLLKSSR